MQTDFAATVGAQHGLERGIKGSRAKHERVKRHYGLVNQAHDQAAELGMLDKASLALGKPTKKALEALEDADSTIALAHEFQARQRANKAREKNLFEQVHELRNMKARVEQEKAEAALAQKQVQELRRELEAESAWRAGRAAEARAGGLAPQARPDRSGRPELVRRRPHRAGSASALDFPAPVWLTRRHCGPRAYRMGGAATNGWAGTGAGPVSLPRPP